MILRRSSSPTCLSTPPRRKIDVIDFLNDTDLFRLDDLAAKKRVSLSLRMTKDPQNARQIVQTYLRMPDQLVTKAHFRSEVTRRVRTTREETANKIRKSGEEAKAEERKLEADKAKKEERDRKLKGMKPDEQRKFLDREREKESKKRQSKRTIKG